MIDDSAGLDFIAREHAPIRHSNVLGYGFSY